MNVSTATSTTPLATTPMTISGSMLAQLAAAFVLGLVMLYATGFSEASVAHNAAHDTRHANGRPCH